MFIGRTDAEAEAPVLWPPDAKSQHTGKGSYVGKDWEQEKGATEDEIVRQHQRLSEHVFERTPEDNRGQKSLAAAHGITESDATQQLNNKYVESKILHK